MKRKIALVVAATAALVVLAGRSGVDPAQVSADDLASTRLSERVAIVPVDFPVAAVGAALVGVA